MYNARFGGGCWILRYKTNKMIGAHLQKGMVHYLLIYLLREILKKQ